MPHRDTVLFSRENLLNIVLVCCAVLLGVGALITMLVIRQEPPQDKWPSVALTEDIAACPGDIYAVKLSPRSAAVFAENVSQSDADAYIASCGAVFEATDLSQPLTARLGDRLVTLTYDPELLHLSVTIARSAVSE